MTTGISNRRATSLVRLPLALSAGLALAACGFHLRGVAQVPQAVQPLYLSCQSGIPYELCSRVRDTLKRSGIVLEDQEQGHYVLTLNSLTSEKRATAITQTAVAAQYELRMTAKVSLSTPDGIPLLTNNPVSTFEDYNYNETSILGARREEQNLNKTLYGRLAQQILFKLTPFTQERIETLRQDYQKKTNTPGKPATSSGTTP
ncbi:LPS-assembly lipoprotein LptE [Mangrovitalea sediminis]|uniref:LPS-assembly lipoprotein LptE n=1 Tax=Mangrovitalea sediminis TaxID=1982043 RepID=UPI000BE61323|nr:LPS assembly lipoprotein LptE [Mangrovitalea sediminis]